MINFFLFHYNDVKLVKLQVESIRKFVSDKNIKIYLTIDADSENMRKKFEETSENLRIEKIHMPKKKLWYFIIEKDIIEKDNSLEEIQIIFIN
jgi:hypothetical protein